MNAGTLIVLELLLGSRDGIFADRQVLKTKKALLIGHRSFPKRGPKVGCSNEDAADDGTARVTHCASDGGAVRLGAQVPGHKKQDGECDETQLHFNPPICLPDGRPHRYSEGSTRPR